LLPERPVSGLGLRRAEGLPGSCGEVTVATMRGGFVYIMTNRPNGTLYVGVTNDIARRAHEHREGLVEGFTRRYGLKRLVWYEAHETITAAIQREKNMKHWPRTWKVRLILRLNPEWEDLYDTLT
jgi:putative endonuclease